MSRLLVFWSHPSHLSLEEAERWTRQQLDELLASDDVARAELLRVRPASPHHAAMYDWMLELHLEPEADVAEWMRSLRWREWFADLRLLGMRPSVLLAGERR